MKRSWVWIFAVLLIVFVFIADIPLMIFYYSHIWEYSADYEEFSDEFNLVKNYIAEEFSDESNRVLMVSHKASEGLALYDLETKSYLTLPDDIPSALKSIYDDAFTNKDSNFDTIRIQDGRISFCIECGEYALVYSPDKKPMYVNSPSEDVKVKVKAIQDGWYHVTKDKWE